MKIYNYLFLLILIILISCNSNKPNLTKIKVGYVPIVGDLPIFVAKEKGFFEDCGFDAELIEFHSGNEAMNSVLMNRTVMEGTLGYSTLFSVWSKEPKGFKIILSTVEEDEKYGSSIVARNDSQIEKIQDIKGKRIGTYTGLTHLLTTKLILQNFMDPDKDVEIIQVEPRLQVQALAAGQYDALFSIEPYPTIAIEKGIAKLIEPNARAANIISPFWAAGTPLSQKFIDENPDKVVKLIDALNKSIDFIKNNENEARACLIKYTPLEKNIADKVPLYKWIKIGNENHNRIQELANIMFKNKLIDSEINIEEMFYKMK